MESREESYRGKQNPMTPLKELAFLAHGGTMTEQERQKKEAGQRSEDATGGRGGEGDLCRLHEAFSKVLKEVMDPLKSIFLNMKENKMLFGSHQSVLFFPLSFFFQTLQGWS